MNKVKRENQKYHRSEKTAIRVNFRWVCIEQKIEIHWGVSDLFF